MLHIQVLVLNINLRLLPLPGNYRSSVSEPENIDLDGWMVLLFFAYPLSNIDAFNATTGTLFITIVICIKGLLILFANDYCNLALESVSDL